MENGTNTGSKGQIIGQVFIFILAGLVFVLIISYGYRAIQGFLERQDQVLLVDFRNDLDTGVETVKRDYGSVRKLELRLPKKFLGLCMFDPLDCAKEKPVLVHPAETIVVEWAQQACQVRSGNAFIVPRTAEDVILPDVEIAAPGYFCIPNIDGKIVLRLEGTGRRAKVSKWS